MLCKIGSSFLSQYVRKLFILKLFELAFYIELHLQEQLARLVRQSDYLRPSIRLSLPVARPYYVLHHVWNQVRLLPVYLQHFPLSLLYLLQLHALLKLWEALRLPPRAGGK